MGKGGNFVKNNVQTLHKFSIFDGNVWLYFFHAAAAASAVLECE